MPQSLNRVLIHIVFSTKRRFPFLSNKSMREEMHAYLGGTCNQLGCLVVTVGGVADHVHILCQLSRSMTVSELVGEIKRSSSKWIKTKGGVLKEFAWQRGYAVFSVWPADVERVRTYISTQEAHHGRRAFQDEYREFLKTCNVEFDERYMWD